MGLESKEQDRPWKEAAASCMNLTWTTASGLTVGSVGLLASVFARLSCAKQGRAQAGLKLVILLPQAPNAEIAGMAITSGLTHKLY